jgi:polyphosphate kinase 2 (PPK2 family)
VFERMLVDAGVTLVKYWLDISKDEQAKRLDKRRSDPLKRLKVSPLDAVAQEKWAAYSEARDTMLTRTHTSTAPWNCVHADDKRAARLGIIRHLLRTIGGDVGRDDADADAVVFPFEIEALTDGRLAP